MRLSVLLFGKGSFFSLPAIPLTKVKDPTGAGDSFAGGTMGCLAKLGKTDENAFRKSLVIGTVMASYCVENFSCRKTSSLKKEDINKRINLLKDYTQIPSFKIS